MGTRILSLPARRPNHRTERVAVVAVALAAALVQFTGAQNTPDKGPGQSSYMSLVREYHEGDADAAALALATWTTERVGALLSARRRSDGNMMEFGFTAASGDSSAWLASVVMLHTEAALRGGPRPSHLALVDSPLTALAARPGAQRFVCSWRILVASWMSALGRFDEAIELARSGEPDAEAFLLEGAIAEGRAQLAPAPLRPLGEVAARGSGANNPWVLLAVAEQNYRAALARDPALLEAAVRLGRVLALQGKRAPALEILSETRKKLDGGFLAYLAALFLGRVYEQAGDSARARECYEEALREYPEAQTPSIALGHLLESSGQPDAGWAVLGRMLAGPPGARRDPMWVYPHAQFWQIDRRLAELRAFARQR